jgi:hypothetical protein
MPALSYRVIDQAGKVIFHPKGLVELLYEGYGDIEGFCVAPDPDVEMYNKTIRTFLPEEDLLEPYGGEPDPLDEFDHLNRSFWFIPDEYKNLDIEQICLAKCQTTEEVNRVKLEITMFRDRHMEDVLKFLYYFVQTLQENNVLWGLGRGSSVASYVLYLLGVHRINSIKYDLDITEFLR